MEDKLMENIDAEISPEVLILSLNANIWLGETLYPVVFRRMSSSSSRQIVPIFTFWLEG
jgi:hypothetical protein